MSEKSPLTFSRLTPSGRGAVGTILLEGKNAFEVFCQYFRWPNGRSLKDCFDNNESSFLDFLKKWKSKPLFGHFCLTESTFEEVVVHLKSEFCIEIHSHGGDSVFQAIAAILKQNGAAFCLQTSENNSTTSEEAFALLPFAKTEKTAQILLDQCSGALDREMAEIQKSFQNIDQKMTQNQFDSASQDSSRLLAKIDHLLSLARWGKHLIQPFRILLLGPTNAGKSSLINALSGFDRTIVDATAGTTRDAVSVELVFEGWPFVLTDSAGIRPTEQALEKIGIRKTLEQISFSDLFLFVFDITSPEKNPFQAFQNVLFKELPKQSIDLSKALFILNKCDLEKQNWNPFWFQTEKTEILNSPILTSMKTNQGIPQIKDAIVQKLISNNYQEGEAVPFRSKHIKSLKEFRDKITNTKALYKKDEL